MPAKRFSPIQKQRAFEEILVQLQAAFAAGELAAGERLPAERQLAEQFNTSRTSVREALRVLEALGVVQVKPGADNGAILLAEPGRAFRDLLEYQLALRHISMASLVEFRIVIEGWLAGAAAERATPDWIGRMDELLASMRAASGYVAFQDLDATFHLEIARATSNDLFALTLEGARTSIERMMVGAMAGMRNWEDMKERLSSEHEAILRAIDARDSVLASDLMTAHIYGFYSDMVLPLAGETLREPTSANPLRR